jgi:hypothetical protein
LRAGILQRNSVYHQFLGVSIPALIAMSGLVAINGSYVAALVAVAILVYIMG